MWKNPLLAEKIIKKEYPVYLIIVLVFVLNCFTLQNINLVDWDEGVFALQAKWIASLGAEGTPFNFQTPPFFQIIIAILFKILGAHDLLLQLTSVVFSCLTVYVLFQFGKTLFSEAAGIYAIVFFVTSEYFFFFAKSGLSDATFLFFFIASLLFFFKALKFNRNKDFILTALFATLCLYTKYSALPLFVIFLIIGFFSRGDLKKYWFFLIIILPAILFSPYLYLFINFLTPQDIGARHISLLGINHMKFLYYIFIFAPLPLIFSILSALGFCKGFQKWDIYIFISVIVFFIVLGFYYPYFRLAYPLIPLLSISAARLIIHMHKYKTYILLLSVIFSITLSIKTINYKSDVPKKIGKAVDYYIEKENINYIYTVLPPNVNFYIQGDITVPSTHPWFRIGKKLPMVLENRMIIEKDKNPLLHEDKILLVHSTIFDTLKNKNQDLYDSSKVIEKIEFVDAPVYYKDIFNPLRNTQQIYEFYLFHIKEINNLPNKFWNFGFDKEVKVIYRETG